MRGERGGSERMEWPSTTSYSEGRAKATHIAFGTRNSDATPFYQRFKLRYVGEIAGVYRTNPATIPLWWWLELAAIGVAWLPAGNRFIV